MLPAVVFHTSSETDVLVKSKVAFRIPRAVSLGHVVWFNGLQLVQVCAAIGLEATRERMRRMIDDISDVGNDWWRMAV